jgi:hypothetical protein
MALDGLNDTMLKVARFRATVDNNGGGEIDDQWQGYTSGGRFGSRSTGREGRGPGQYG